LPALVFRAIIYYLYCAASFIDDNRNTGECLGVIVFVMLFRVFLLSLFWGFERNHGDALAF